MEFPMREEQGPVQDLTHASATADCISRLSRSISNRHNSGLKPVVTYSKQSTATHSNRHKFVRTGSSFSQPPALIGRAILLTPLCHLLYICRVLEETSGLRAASNRCNWKRLWVGGRRVRARVQGFVHYIRPNAFSEESRRGVSPRPISAWNVVPLRRPALRGEKA